MTSAIANIIIDNVKTSIGLELWDKFQSETQTGIITSELCFLSFKDDNGFDFSSAIIPIMKSLELELQKTFYEPYLEFIVTNYATPEEYVKENWKENYPGDQRAAQLRGKILSFDGRSLHFQPLSSEFTLGNFRYLIGAINLWCVCIDKSFLKYCKNVLFKDYTVSTHDIIIWIKELVLCIEGLRLIRNDSSHAGNLQNAIDAKTVLDKLIEVDKVLTSIVSPPFLR